ncbi:ABC transporter substrate-binding protein, partial [Gallintestinimicrobium sp.]
MKKKYLALVLAACMTASLAACGSTAADTSAPAATTEEAADTAAAESTEAADTAAATGEHGPSSEAAPAWEDYDARIAAIRSETDLVKREALMHEAEDELMNTWAVVPLYYYNDSYLQKTDVENIYANLFGYKYFGFAKTPTNTLDLQIASEPDKLDPALNSTVDGACLAILNFSGLFAYDENGQLVPELADSYEMSEDGMTYTFTMKDGLKWSDGEALDANDVLYSWNRLADENTAADYSYLCSVFATKDDGTLDIEASEDGKTFTAHLNAPCAYFLDLCAFPAFYPVPQQAVEAADGADTNPGAWALEAGFVGSGPFVLTEWKHNES